MRNRIVCAIGVLWGGAIVIFGLLKETPPNVNPNYQAGQTMGLLMGAVMFVAGLYYLFRATTPSSNRDDVDA